MKIKRPTTMVDKNRTTTTKRIRKTKRQTEQEQEKEREKGRERENEILVAAGGKKVVDGLQHRIYKFSSTWSWLQFCIFYIYIYKCLSVYEC